MTKRLKILLVVTPERKDFYDYLSAASNTDFYILWYVKKKDAEFISLPSFISGQYFWGEYTTPFSLLEKIKPDRIIFFEIIDLRQIALIVAAKRKRISTFYLEHGAAGDKETAILRWDEKGFKTHKLPYLKKRFLNFFWDVFKSKLFYYFVTGEFTSLRSYLKYFFLPFKMLKGSPNKILAHNKFPERVPDFSIVFNKANFEEYALYTGITETQAGFTGVPFFDSYYAGNLHEENHIVYIDHPYLEERILGWTAQYHTKISEALFSFAESNKMKLYIKLHPRSEIKRWLEYKFNPENVQILQAGDFTELYLRAKLILGFSSSLMIGLLSARKNIVLLGWHPQPKIFGYDFSKTGLCHISLYPEDLLTKYKRWKEHNLTLENDSAYCDFLKEYNYPFDGKATERVIKAIMTNEIL
jgi:hypothetical protein